MNKKIFLSIFIILLLAAGFFLYFLHNQEKKNELAVKNVIEGFGNSLKNVSLLAPPAILNQDLDKNYKDFLSPALLEEWKKDSSQALGRLTSSPWPDRIEISKIEKVSNSSYLVEGYIIEVTNGNGTAIKRHVFLKVEKIDNRWLISQITVGAYEDAWNIFSSADLEFQYPENLPAQYISPAEWPPRITISEGKLECQESSSENNFPLTTARKTIDNNEYCVQTRQEGAAGSTYIEYCLTLSPVFELR